MDLKENTIEDNGEVTVDCLGTQHFEADAVGSQTFSQDGEYSAHK